MGIVSRILLIILVIIFFLAIIGLGWDTFFQGVKKGADKIGITSIVGNATNSLIFRHFWDFYPIIMLLNS
jgi:hypothetical protein